MLIVKLFCWEYQVMKQINEVRAHEVTQLKKFAYLYACMMFLMYALTARHTPRHDDTRRHTHDTHA